MPILVLMCGLAPAVLAQPAFELGELRIPAPRGYVNDFAGVLSPDEWSRLEALCRQIDRETGAQIALAIVSDLEGETPGDVKTRLFEVWRVGRAHDDRGLLILHAISERRIEVETGYGLEPVLTDARIGEILDREVVPPFRAGRLYDGYAAGIAAFGRRIAEKDPDARAGSDAYRSGRTQGQKKRGFPWGLVIFGPILLYIFIRHPRLFMLLLLSGALGGGRGGGMRGFGGGFGGFGGGMSGGGGAGRSY
jgi:uncharacterized protein